MASTHSPAIQRFRSSHREQQNIDQRTCGRKCSYVQAQKHNDPRRYQARVTFMPHEADLALITVDDPEFFAIWR